MIKIRDDNGRDQVQAVPTRYPLRLKNISYYLPGYPSNIHEKNADIFYTNRYSLIPTNIYIYIYIYICIYIYI